MRNSAIHWCEKVLLLFVLKNDFFCLYLYVRPISKVDKSLLSRPELMLEGTFYIEMREFSTTICAWICMFFFIRLEHVCVVCLMINVLYAELRWLCHYSQSLSYPSKLPKHKKVWFFSRAVLTLKCLSREEPWKVGQRIFRSKETKLPICYSNLQKAC